MKLLCYFLSLLCGWGAASFDNTVSNCYIGPVAGTMLNSTSAVSITHYRTLVAGGDVYYFLSKGDGPGGQDNLYTMKNSVALDYFSSSQGQEYQRSGGSPNAAGLPLFNVTLSYIYGISNIAVFTNGVLQQGKLWATVPVVPPAANNNKPLRLGSRQGTVSGQYYRGVITDVAIWNTNLNTFECLNLSSHLKRVAMQIRRQNLVAYWSWDTVPTGMSIIKERDWSANGNHFTNEITPATSVPEAICSYPPNE